jgi:hypothetical protein
MSGTRGGFFAVDRETWAKVCALGMNPAVAYLVLARFSDKHNTDTRGSVHAVETHTQISRGRAKTAIDTLIEKRLITKGAADPKHPRYVLVKPKNAIWLPNELVTGAAAETPPVERVRQTQDPMCLRLLVDLYDGQNLREDGGVSRAHVYQMYKRVKVGERGAFIIWGFSGQSSTTANYGELANPHRRKQTEAEKQQRSTVGELGDFFDRLGNLVSSGLIEWIPYVFEAERLDAEPMFPCAQHGGGIEAQIGAAAEEAAKSLLSEELNAYAERECLILVPLPRHMGNVAMFGVARLRYRPKTALTAAWWGDLNEKGTKLIAYFKLIADGDTTAAWAAS